MSTEIQVEDELNNALSHVFDDGDLFDLLDFDIVRVKSVDGKIECLIVYELELAEDGEYVDESTIEAFLDYCLNYLPNNDQPKLFSSQLAQLLMNYTLASVNILEDIYSERSLTAYGEVLILMAENEERSAKLRAIIKQKIKQSMFRQSSIRGKSATDTLSDIAKFWLSFRMDTLVAHNRIIKDAYANAIEELDSDPVLAAAFEEETGNTIDYFHKQDMEEIDELFDEMFAITAKLFAPISRIENAISIIDRLD